MAARLSIPSILEPLPPSSRTAVWGDVSDDAGFAVGTAEWISYDEHGFTARLGGFAPNSADANGNDFLDNSEATAVFTRSFAIGGPGEFNFWMLADDTATVVLSGPGGSNESSRRRCAITGRIRVWDLVIGCLEQDMGIKQR